MQIEFQPLSQNIQTLLEAGVVLAGLVGYYVGTSYNSSAEPKKIEEPQILDRISIDDLPAKVVPIAKDVDVTNLRDLLLRTVPAQQIEGHYIHSLNIEGKYQAFEVYGHPEKTSTTGVVHFGEKLCGHPGIVHGGCISTVFDELFGWTMIWMTGKVGFTANLSVNFRKPLPATTFGIITTEFEKKEGRKMFMKAKLEDNDGNLYADATALFILPREQ